MVDLARACRNMLGRQPLRGSHHFVRLGPDASLVRGVAVLHLYQGGGASWRHCRTGRRALGHVPAIDVIVIYGEGATSVRQKVPRPRSSRASRSVFTSASSRSLKGRLGYAIQISG